MFIAEVFGANDSFQQETCQKISCHFQIVYIQASRGFVDVISPARNLFVHSKRQIVDSSASFPGIQPPPTPSPDASTQPRNSGSPMTNSFAIVGSRSASFSSVLQSWNSCFLDSKYFHRTICGFTCSILLIGFINFFPVGTAVAACQIFPIKFSIRLNGTHFSCAHSFESTQQSHFDCTAPVRSTVLRHQPSNLTPIFSLTIGLCLPPCSS